MQVENVAVRALQPYAVPSAASRTRSATGNNGIHPSSTTGATVARQA